MVGYTGGHCALNAVNHLGTSGLDAQQLQRCDQRLLLLVLLHPVNGLFSRTTWVSRYQKGKTSPDLNEMGFWDGSGINWTIYKKICTTLQIDNHINTPLLNFFIGRMIFLMPNQQCQSTEGVDMTKDINTKLEYRSVLYFTLYTYNQ